MRLRVNASALHLELLAFGRLVLISLAAAITFIAFGILHVVHAAALTISMPSFDCIKLLLADGIPENLRSIRQFLFSHPRQLRAEPIHAHKLFISWRHRCIFLFQFSQVIFDGALAALVSFRESLHHVDVHLLAACRTIAAAAPALLLRPS